MTRVFPNFKDRSFARVNPPNLNYRVESYSWNVLGGPDRALLKVTGEIGDLWSLFDFLRYDIVLDDDAGDSVWWGFVAAITIRVGALEFGLSLDTMANKIAVLFTNLVPGESGVGQSAMTAWASNTDSTTMFGTKERLERLSEASTAAAEKFRDTRLEQLKYPIGKRTFSGPSGEAVLTMECRGWMDTLRWRHYSNAAGLEAHNNNGNSTQNMGDVSGQQAVAQSFTLSVNAAFRAYNASVRIKKVGAPVDNLLLELMSDSAGAPNAVIATATVSGGIVPTSTDWLTATFAVPVDLVYGTPYWLRARRSGAVDAVNYFVVNVDEALGYTGGVFRIYNGASWVARGVDADLAFKVGAMQETTTQITNIETACGEFITGVDIQNASGVYSSPYRDGYSLALDEVLTLLAQGTASGKRLLARVTKERILQIYREPASTGNNSLALADGTFADANSEPIDSHRCPVGFWARMKDIVPDYVSVVKLSDPSLMFIEAMEYNTASGRLTPRVRDDVSVWDVGKVTV